MGKKLQGAKLRAKKRAQEAVNALQEAQADAAARGTVSNEPDELLFVLDSAGDSHAPLYKNAVATGAFSKEKKRKFNADDDGKKKKKPPGSSSSSVDQALVEKLLAKKNHDAESLRKVAERGRALLEQSQRKRGMSSSVSAPASSAGRARKRLHQGTSSRASYDLWQNDDGNNDNARAARPASSAVEAPLLRPIAGLSLPHPPTKARTYSVATRASSAAAAASKAAPSQSSASAAASAAATAVVTVEVATGGQSYHPDPILHNRQLEVAVEVERRRLAALQQKEEPIAKGLSEETKQYMVGDDDDTSDDGEEGDEEGEAAASSTVVPKKIDKLTTAQRHKQRRLRREQDEIRKRREAKQLAHQLSEIPKVRKELNRKEQELQERRRQLAALKESQQRVLGSNVEVVLSERDPIRAPTIPVALPSEIGRGGGSGGAEGRSSASASAGAGRASLRTIRPKGSLVLDRVHSMVDRKMAPSKNRLAAAPKKRKIKVQGKVAGPGFEIKG